MKFPGGLKVSPEAVKRVGMRNQQEMMQGLANEVMVNPGLYADLVCPECGGGHFWQAFRMKKVSQFDPKAMALGSNGDVVVHLQVWLCVGCKAEVSFIGKGTAVERKAE